MAYCCSSGFGKFRCFYVSCACFFCVVFVSVLFALLLVFVVGYSCFVFCFFLEGLRVR